MQSIRSDQPAAAALLVRRGASLDQTNHAGESARDMAKARNDAKLDQALGLRPWPERSAPGDRGEQREVVGDPV